MNISGLSLQEVSKKVKEFLPLFLQEDFYFAECYQLEFSEIKHSISPEYHGDFKDDYLTNCASGSVELPDSDYIVSLVNDAEQKRALFLIVQKADKKTDAEERVIFKSFRDTDETEATQTAEPPTT